MKRIYNFISIAVLAFAAIGCIEDIHTDMPSAERGDEVQFGLSLDGPKTKTVYGMEANNAFPVYWVNGDKVAVYSPECLTGRNSAEYQVSVSQAQNYADQLTKTGEVGVQWGSSDNATFYSIYPSANATISGSGDNVIAALNIPSTQMLTHTLVDGTYYASDMNSVIMYAKKSASKSDGAVNLQYTPYSTVIEFELTGDFSSNAKASLFIESLTFTAPAPATEGATAPYLAGNFNFRFTETPEISATGNNRSNVTLQFSTQPELNNSNKTLKAKMCLMPIGVASLEGWTISVTLREGDNARKTLVKTLGSNDKTALIAGMVHKIKLPALTATKEWTYTPQNWIPQLPEYQKIYLTELSLPGAWYAGTPTDHGYQSTQDIATLWRKGVRAFAVETKCVVEGNSTSVESAEPIGVAVSGTGFNSSQTFASGYNTLHGNTTMDNATVYKDRSFQLSSFSVEYAILLPQVIKNIINCLIEQNNANTEKEFAVLVLSYADGGASGRRYVDYGAWLDLIYDAYNSLTQDYKDYIYSKEISSGTTVEDVLGKLIIKVNVDANIALGGNVTLENTNYQYLYENNLPALFSYTPFLTQLTHDDYERPLFSTLNWCTWEDSYRYISTANISKSDFMWCFTSAHRTHSGDATNVNYETPTYGQRQLALMSMIEQSKKIYESSNHNVWFYFNAGGTQIDNLSDNTSSSHAIAFATKMNEWLLTTINNKINGYTKDNVFHPSDPSPLGIVMFNQCTNDTYNGPAIIKAIVEMNNKFPLKRKGGLDETLVGIDSWDSVIL